MAPGGVSSSNGQELSASLETPETAHPSFQADKSSPEAGEMYSPQDSELIVSTEDVSSMDPSFLSSDVSTSTADLSITNLPEKQERFDSAASLPDTDSSHTANDISRMLPTETTSTELPELPFGPFSGEDAQEVASPSDVFYASDAIVEAMDLCSPEDEVFPNVSREQPDMRSPSCEAGLVETTSEVNETPSAKSSEVVPSNSSPYTETASDILPGAMEVSTAEDDVVSACKEDQPGMQSLSTNVVLPDMPSEVAYANSDESQEVTTTGPPAPIDDPPKMLPSVLILRPSDGSVHSYFTEDQPSPNSPILKTGHANMISEAIEANPTESAESIEANNSESSVESSNMALSFPVMENTTETDETPKSLPTEVIERKYLSKAASEVVSVELEILDAKVKFEDLEVRFVEISELGLAAPVSRDESLASTPENSTVVAGPFEEQSDIQEHYEPAEVTSDVNFALAFRDHSGTGSGERDKNMTDSSDSAPETEEITSQNPMFLPSNSSTALISTLEGSTDGDAQEFQEISASENDATSVLDPMALAVDLLNNASQTIYTIAHKISNSVFSPQSLNTNSTLEAIEINSVVAETSETVQPEIEEQTRSTSSTPLGSPRYYFEDMDVEYMSVEADTTKVHPVVAERSELISPKMEEQARSASTSPLSSPRYSIADMDDDSIFGKQATSSLQDLNLPDAPISDLAPHSVHSTTMPDRFDLKGQETTEQFAFESSLPNSPSAEERNTDCEVDEDKHTESLATAFEHSGRRFPEIKLEPIPIELISCLDTLPSPTKSSSFSREHIEPSSSIVKEEESLSEASLDKVSLADTDALTTVGENFHVLSSDMKAEPDTVDAIKDIQSPDTRRTLKPKPPRKRTPSPEEDETDFQQPPAKKLRQEVVPACDAPQIKAEDGLDGIPEKNEVSQLVAQHPLSPTNDKRTIISPSSTPPYTNLDQVKTEIIDFKTGVMSCLTTQKSQNSTDRIIEKQKMVSTATSNSTKSLRPTVKK